jgi:uncharacterized protein (DUF1778 family)
MPNQQRRKDERLDLRLSAAAKTLLQRAAAARHKSLSEFVIDSSLSAAAEALADRRELLLNDEQWQAFVAALDAPDRARPELDRLLREPSVFE